MLIVKQNTYPTINLKSNDIVQWIRGNKCYYLYKSPIENITFDKKHFVSPNCNKDGIKPNGKQIDLVGIVGELKKKGYILELEYVKENELI